MAEGLDNLGNGAWAWLAHSNSWGWSNAGLIVDGEEMTELPPEAMAAIVAAAADKAVGWRHSVYRGNPYYVAGACGQLDQSLPPDRRHGRGQPVSRVFP